MDLRILRYLNSQGIFDPICSCCLSNEFESFVIFSNIIVCCNNCNPRLLIEGPIMKNKPIRDVQLELDLIGEL